MGGRFRPAHPVGGRLALSFPFVRALREDVEAGRGHIDDVDFIGTLVRVLDKTPEGARYLTDARLRSLYGRWRKDSERIWAPRAPRSRR